MLRLLQPDALADYITLLCHVMHYVLVKIIV